MKKLLAISIMAGLFSVPAISANTAEDEFIKEKLSRMSVQDKLGQLNQLEGRIDIKKLEAEIRAGRVSSIMNIVNPKEIDRLQAIAVKESPAGIPILFSRDVIHGFKTMMPIPLGLAASFDEEIVENGARVAAIEATEAGIKWGFSPMIDVSRDSRWGRIAESFGEDALVNARLGVAHVKGFQTDNLKNPTALAACAKHFVGYGAGRGGRDYNGSDLTERELRDTYLVPFKAVLQSGCASVMTSFQDNDGLQVSANSWLLMGVLRNEWGWDGVVDSDYGSIGQLTKHGIAATRKDAARIGLNCGSDVDMQSKVFIQHGEQLINEGAVTMDVLDKAVANVLRMKYRLGLFDSPYTQTFTKQTKSKAHIDVALKAAVESAVLLKNNGVLPLDTTKALTILVTGPLSDARYDQLGTWDMDGDTNIVVTPKEAFLKRNGGKVKVLYVPGLTYGRDKDKSTWKSVAKAAKKADVIVVCLGEEQILSGEAHSLADIGLKGAQTEYVEFLSTLKKPLVATVMSGRANTVEKELSFLDALLWQFHPGTMGGEALAKLVFGEEVPSGKLPITFPRMVGQCPIYYNEFRTGRSSNNKRAVNSLDEIPRNPKQSVLGHDCRYLDAGTKPLFPFGFGLSYTQFKFGKPLVENTTLLADDTLRFSVPLSNIGSRAAKEVVQVYIKDRFASMSRPVRELKDFRKVLVQPGETQFVDFAIPVSSLGFYNWNMEYEVGLGDFDVEVSDCSDPSLCPSAGTFSFEVVAPQERKCDVCVYGESASGCVAAIEAARNGKSTILVAKNGHVGGLVTSGLTATDMNKNGIIGGIAAEFYGRIWDYYMDASVWRNQTRDEFMTSTLKRTFTGKNDKRKIQWVYESGVAENIMKQMLAEAGVTIVAGAQVRKVEKSGTTIKSIALNNGVTVAASMFIDASYTGDLMAKSGVSYVFGRESIAQYGESFAGIRVNTDKDDFGDASGIDPATGKPLPYVDAQLWGKPGDGDSRMQSYCYRVTLTDDPANMKEITKPEGYDPMLYELLIKYILHYPQFELKNVITFTPMPNKKTDTNHLDFFGAAHAYPQASYLEKLKIEAYHRIYAQGMLWFLGHDERVPEPMRKEMLRWGYAADEFKDSDNFPNHMYVREARRMVGEYVMTQKNLQKVGREDAPESVGRGSYPLDCHYISHVIYEGKLYREGTMFQSVPTYPISYKSLTPKKGECTNLLVTVCLSASHVAYASLRMEPQYMVLGQSAADAACLSIDNKCAVQDLKYEILQEKLTNNKQIL